MIGGSVLAYFGMVLLSCCIAILFYMVYISKVTLQTRRQLAHAWMTFKPHIKVKTLLGFYMIATKIESVYEVTLPPAVTRLLSTFAVGVSLGFNGMRSVLECLDMRGYIASLIIHILTPIILALLILLVAVARMLCTSQCNTTTLLEMALPLLLKLFFVAYPVVTNLAFEAFPCYTFIEGEWLKADVSIQCGTSKHDQARRLAWTAILL